MSNGPGVAFPIPPPTFSFWRAWFCSLDAPRKGRARHSVRQADGDRDALETLVRNLAGDSLSRPVKRMIFHDSLWTLLPARNDHDRGRAWPDGGAEPRP